MSTESKTNKPYDSVKLKVNQVRRNHILSEAQNVLVLEGYSKLTMRKVAGVAGISVGHLQHFFPSKEILLRDIFRFISNEYVANYNSILKGLSAKQPDVMLGTIIEFVLGSISNGNTRTFF